MQASRVSPFKRLAPALRANALSCRAFAPGWVGSGGGDALVHDAVTSAKIAAKMAALACPE